MGLDLSLTSTGWSCDGEYGVISSKNKKTQRLVDISGEILKKCSKHKVETVVIEGYSFASRSGQAFSIGELGGVVRFCLLQSGFEFVEVPPTVRANLQPVEAMQLSQKLFQQYPQRLELSGLVLGLMTCATLGY